MPEALSPKSALFLLKSHIGRKAAGMKYAWAPDQGLSSPHKKNRPGAISGSDFALPASVSPTTGVRRAPRGKRADPGLGLREGLGNCLCLSLFI